LSRLQDFQVKWTGTGLLVLETSQGGFHPQKEPDVISSNIFVNFEEFHPSGLIYHFFWSFAKLSLISKFFMQLPLISLA
jgi:hypothetical protein